MRLRRVRISIEAIPPIGGQCGAPCFRPQRVLGDGAYDPQTHRQALAERGIKSGLAWRRLPHGMGLGTLRWVVESTIAWLHHEHRTQMQLLNTALLTSGRSVQTRHIGEC